jgi:lysophospholipase L1-like esterase
VIRDNAFPALSHPYLSTQFAMRRLFTAASSVCLIALLVQASLFAQTPATNLNVALLEKSPRIVFLGDSITASGQYIANFDAWLLTQKLKQHPQIIGAGLSSETVSGLSEEGHAGGKFPRPDLAERLDRILDLTRPNLVLACYGINCGIYQPFAAERLEKYQAGYQRLKAAVEKRGAKLIVITPPYFDDQRKKGSFSYNEVLDQYAAWLVKQRDSGWQVIDLHSTMTAAVAKTRETMPMFTFQPDAVHPNEAGHWFITQQLALAFGDAEVTKFDSPEAMLKARGIAPEVLPLVNKRMSMLRDSYVHTAGHKRPGVAKGLPVAEAETQAAELTKQIEAFRSAK